MAKDSKQPTKNVILLNILVKKQEDDEYKSEEGSAPLDELAKLANDEE